MKVSSARRAWVGLLLVAAVFVAGPPRARGEGIDDLIGAELDKITRKHKAARRKAERKGQPFAERLRLHGERGRTVATAVFVRKSDPRATLRATLAARRKLELGPWYYAGPFDGKGGRGLEGAWPVEDGIDLMADFEGLGGRRFGWKPWPRFGEGGRNSLDLKAGRDGCVCCLYRRLTTTEPIEVPMVMGCSWPIVVFLNGKAVARSDGRGGFDLAREKLWLKLRAGENVLLVKARGRGERLEFGSGDFGSARQAVEEMIMTRMEKELARSDPKLVRDFVLQRDWLHWDRAVLAKGYGAAARSAMKLAKDTLSLVWRAAERPKLAAELAALDSQFTAAGAEADWQELYLRARRLRRRIILSHPLLGFERLLVSKRTPPGYSHMCDQYLGRHSGAGDGLVVLENWRDQPRARRLLADRLPVGTTHYPDLSYDATRVLFAFCDHTEPDRTKRRFWLYEATIDPADPFGPGSRKVRQITGVPGRDPMEGQDGRKTVLIEDWDPCYLPNGDIVFISTRNQAYGRCHGGRYTPAYVLYRCGPNGENIRRISWGEANEWDPSVLHDGRLVYTRWDYINRHDTFYQSLWATRPDGTATAHFYGNNSRNPCMIAEARAIPGSHCVVATAMAHHSYTAGSIIVIDPLRGMDGLASIRRVTPEARFPEGEGGTLGPHCTPWPLSEDLFLVAHTPDRLAFQGSRQRDNAYGIYLVDTAGGRELIYRDRRMSCFSPIPLQPRPKPPAVASASKPTGADGIFFLHNVYASGDLGVEPIPPGTAKYVRIVGILEQPIPGAPIRSISNNEIVKWIIGTVPLDAGGSVAFRAPANEPLLFQVLDANFMSVMAMRSQAYLQPGEMMSCVGCHEPAGTTSSLRRPRPLDVRNPAPPPGPHYEGGFSFARTVQPVLDRHCIRCHGLGGQTARPKADALAELSGSKPGARVSKMSLLGTQRGSFSEAYDALTSKGGIRLAQRNGEAVPSRPKDYGSHASKLAPMLLAGHKRRVKLDTGSFRRIAGWLDLNVQYYGDYSFRRAERRKPSRDGLRALRAYLKARCGRCHKALGDQRAAALVNVAWPDESRALQAPLPVAEGGWGQCRSAFAGKNDPRYRTLREKVHAATGPPEGGPAR